MTNPLFRHGYHRCLLISGSTSSFYILARREAGPHDIQIEIVYCGVCHSDIHLVRNEWGNSIYPMVPGHEIVGRVTKVGDQVRRDEPPQ